MVTRIENGFCRKISPSLHSLASWRLTLYLDSSPSPISVVKPAAYQQNLVQRSNGLNERSRAYSYWITVPPKQFTQPLLDQGPVHSQQNSYRQGPISISASWPSACLFTHGTGGLHVICMLHAVVKRQPPPNTHRGPYCLTGEMKQTG